MTDRIDLGAIAAKYGYKLIKVEGDEIYRTENSNLSKAEETEKVTVVDYFGADGYEVITYSDGIEKTFLNGKLVETKKVDWVFEEEKNNN
jgi:hypothetical protein